MGEKHCFSSSVDFFFLLCACLLSGFNNFGSLIHKKVSKICHVLWVCTKSTIIQYIWYTLTVMLEWMLIEFILKAHVRDIHCLTIYCTLQMKSGVVTVASKSHSGHWNKDTNLTQIWLAELNWPPFCASISSSLLTKAKKKKSFM